MNNPEIFLKNCNTIFQNFQTHFSSVAKSVENKMNINLVLSEYYLFLDFDNVLTVEGEFVNGEVKALVKYLQDIFSDVYIKKSISGTGLCGFLKPTAGKFKKIKATYYFDDTRAKDSPKLENSSKTESTYCLLKGKKFNNGDKVPEGEDVDAVFEELLYLIEKQSSRKTVVQKQGKYLSEPISDHSEEFLGGKKNG